MRLDLNKKKKYLLACSHGPDSMALFDMLKKQGYDFDVAHVNYHLRPESDLEEKQLSEECNKNNIKLFVKNITSNTIVHNIEAECRKIRYEFFKELVDLYHYEAALVAHHQDDLIETYLMQKRRKNLPKIYGIEKITSILGVTIIRPLLSFSKSDLLKYCQESRINFSIDSSNLQDSYLRNQIRHSIVEKMSVQERAKILKEINEKNEGQEQRIEALSALDLSNVNVLLSLNFKDLVLAFYLLNPRPDISFSLATVKEFETLLKSDKVNIRRKIKNNLYFEKSYGRCRIFEKDVIRYSYRFNQPCVFDCEYFYLNFLFDSRNRNVLSDSYPITIRNAQPDDVVTVAGYKKKVSRLFIDWKLPLYLRDRWPVIIDRTGNIIYIPRYQKHFVVDKKCNFFVK